MVRPPHARRAATVAASAAAAAMAMLTGCSASDSDPGATPAPTATSSSTPGAVQTWQAAYSFLGAQTKPTQIFCGWFRATKGHPAPVARPTHFYDFSHTAGGWRAHTITRFDPLPRGVFEMCSANVPTSVPYGLGIEDFLRQYGLVFGVDKRHARGLQPIEIAYAGQNASDPDIIYHDQPGLFALSIALRALGDAPFEPGTSRIIPPTDQATATRYLSYAAPLLSWYGYQG